MHKSPDLWPHKAGQLAPGPVVAISQPAQEKLILLGLRDKDGQCSGYSEGFACGEDANCA